MVVGGGNSRWTFYLFFFSLNSLLSVQRGSGAQERGTEKWWLVYHLVGVHNAV